MHDLDELLRASAPPVHVGDSADAARDVATAVARRYRPRWLRKRRALVAAVAGVVLIPAAAAAAIHGAQTGRFGLPGMTENDTSQYIDMCAPDIRSYVGTLEPRTQPLPPGTTWDRLAAQFISSFSSECPPKGPGSETQVTGIRNGLLEFSTCPWEHWALSAPPATAASNLSRADQMLANLQVEEHKVNPHGTDGWQHYRDMYAHASRSYLNYDYYVNCLGHEIAGNSPTPAEPTK